MDGDFRVLWEGMDGLNNKRHVVSADDGALETCTCPDYDYWGLPCVHMLMVQVLSKDHCAPYEIDDSDSYKGEATDEELAPLETFTPRPPRSPPEPVKTVQQPTQSVQQQPTSATNTQTPSNQPIQSQSNAQNQAPRPQDPYAHSQPYMIYGQPQNGPAHHLSFDLESFLREQPASPPQKQIQPKQVQPNQAQALSPMQQERYSQQRIPSPQQIHHPANQSRHVSNPPPPPPLPPQHQQQQLPSPFFQQKVYTQPHQLQPQPPPHTTGPAPNNMILLQDYSGPLLLMPLINGYASIQGDWRVRLVGSPPDNHHIVQVRGASNMIKQCDCPEYMKNKETCMHMYLLRGVVRESRLDDGKPIVILDDDEEDQEDNTSSKRKKLN